MDFQAMPHDMLNTKCWNLNKYIDEQNIGGLQCMVWHDNDKAKDMCWSKRKQSSIQWKDMKNIDLA